jgi:hypothetical protein
VKEPEELYIVYGLIDPRTRELRYIGQTRSVHSRRKAHRHGNNGAQVGVWERELKTQGLEPEMVVLQDNLMRDEINQVEADWIARMLQDGAQLLNVLAGAGGLWLHPYPEETRIKIAESMCRHWQDPAFRAEKIAKMTEAVRTPEVRARISAAHKGRKLSEEDKARVSESVRALWEDPEYRSSQGEAVRAGLEKTRANTEAEAKRLATIRTEEHRAKIGEKSRQMWQNPESRAKLMEARRTQARPSEESRRKTGESLRRAYAEGRMTRERTEAERQKTSDGMKRAYAEGRRARVYSEAHRRAISEGLKKAFAERKRRKAAGE